MLPWVRDAMKEFLQRIYLRRQFLWRLPDSTNVVALTFDDGPDPVFTPALLDLLARENVTASFFLIGSKVEQFPDIAKRLVKEGHKIGGHTHSHVEITLLSAEGINSEMERCRVAIRNATGVDTTLFRPPRGKVNFTSLRRVCSLGYLFVHWSKTYSDYVPSGSAALIKRMRDNPIKSRDIVLLHDHNQDTISALAQFIPEWKRSGIVFKGLEHSQAG